MEEHTHLCDFLLAELAGQVALDGKAYSSSEEEDFDLIIHKELPEPLTTIAARHYQQPELTTVVTHGNSGSVVVKKDGRVYRIVTLTQVPKSTRVIISVRS